MASTRRRRKRRSADYRAPTTRRQAREGREEAARPARPSRRKDPDRPPAPWGAFPLVEIVILIALVLLIVGFFIGDVRGGIMIGAGVALGSLAALELTLREHFAGYRSHTSVLAGFVAVIVLGVGFFLDWSQGVKVAAGVGAFAL